MEQIQKLENQLSNLLANCDSDIIRAKGSLMKETIREIKSELSSKYTESCKAITWGIGDFEGTAQNRWEHHTLHYPDAESWEDVYDEEKFEEALIEMINKHDATIGITWDSVEFWLDEKCLKKKP